MEIASTKIKGAQAVTGDKGEIIGIV